MDFLESLATHAFLQHALLGGLLASVAAGVVGSYVVTRRISYLAGSIAHFVLGGMGAARYAQVMLGWTFMTPLLGAVVAALFCALLVGVVSLKAREREDTVIGALWAMGMATGILFISRTPGFNEDLMSYLFGNILMISREQLYLLILLDALVLILGVLLYNPLLLICFDEEYARVRGLPVDLFYLVLLGLTALTVVVLTQVVGIVLVIALLTLPAAVAGLRARTLWQMMILGTGVSMVSVTSGLWLSFGPDLPAGATIILCLGAVYLLGLGVRRLVGP